MSPPSDVGLIENWSNNIIDQAISESSRNDIIQRILVEIILVQRVGPPRRLGWRYLREGVRLYEVFLQRR
jgi:hypothetical protein